MSEWTKMALADACESIDYGYTTSAQEAPVGPRFLRITDIVSGHLRWDEVPYCEIPEGSVDRYRRTDGDIVVARTGASTGCSMYISNPPEAVFASYLVRLHLKEEFDPRFVAYCLKSAEFLHFISAASSGKSAQPNASAKTITQAQLRVPSLPEQRRIAHILGTLDDKIELNRRMNRTLEAIARAVFKSWFIDFDPVIDNALASGKPIPEEFAARAEIRRQILARNNGGEGAVDYHRLFPDEFQDSPLGKIPKGWRVAPIVELCDRVAMGPFGSSIKVSTFVKDGIPVISGQHVRGTHLEDLEYNFITPEHAEKLSNANVFRGDVIFTHAGSIGQVAFIPSDSRYDRYVISQRQFYMRCDTSLVLPEFITHYFKSHKGQHELLANSTSTGVPSIARPVTYLRSLKMMVPPLMVQQRFAIIVASCTHRATANFREAHTLETTRDALLPRLLSGALAPLEGES